MVVALANTTSASTRQEPLRVMVVDDSVVIRGLISRWIGAEPDMVVAASLRTGLEAVQQLDRIKPDVAVLDIEMPELDGISALPQLLAKKRDLIIIMASTLTRRTRRSASRRSRWRFRLHPEAGKHPRAGGRRDLPPRSDPEDPRLRRQGSPYRAAVCIAAAGAIAAACRETARRRRCACTRTASRGGAAGPDAPRLRLAGAARAGGRLLDRRPAGADVAGHRVKI